MELDNDVLTALKLFILGTIFWAFPSLVPSFIYDVEFLENWLGVISGVPAVLCFVLAYRKVSRATKLNK